MSKQEFDIRALQLNSSEVWLATGSQMDFDEISQTCSLKKNQLAASEILYVEAQRHLGYKKYCKVAGTRLTINTTETLALLIKPYYVLVSICIGHQSSVCLFFTPC